VSRAILFDVDGVLVHSRFHPDTARRRLWDAHLLEDLGVDPEKFQQLFGPEFMDVITGRRSLVEILDRFLPTVGYSGSTLSFVTYWLERDSHLNLPLLDAIGRLGRQGDVLLYLATNQEHLRAAYLWREFRLSHVFKEMFYAARLGAAKPDPRFFERVTALLPRTDEPPLLFDDSLQCVNAATAFGWEGCQVTDLADFATHPFIAERLAG
jgi:putative hydrolase of the HAD superfamily